MICSQSLVVDINFAKQKIFAIVFTSVSSIRDS